MHQKPHQKAACIHVNHLLNWKKGFKMIYWEAHVAACMNYYQDEVTFRWALVSVHYGRLFWEHSEGHWTHCPQSIIWTSRYVLRFELNCRKLWRSRRMFEEYQYSTASRTWSADFRLIFRMNLTRDLYASFTTTHLATCTTQIEAYFHNR